MAILGVVACLMWLAHDVSAVTPRPSTVAAPPSARLYLGTPAVFTYPLTSTLDICDTFGPRLLIDGARSRYNFHLGVDWCADAGTPVHAITTGTVQSLNDDCAVSASTCFVHLTHAAIDGQTRYDHLSGVEAGITTGLQITPGQVIGWVGADGSGSPAYLHLEVHDGLTVTERAAIHPLSTPFLPWTNAVSPTAALSGVYTDVTGMTALVQVTSPYTEPDLMTVSVAVTGSVTASRTLDYGVLNAAAASTTALDDPLVEVDGGEVCLILLPTGLDEVEGYGVTMAFRQLDYGSPATVTARAFDVDGGSATATLGLAGGLAMTPPTRTVAGGVGRAVTLVYTLTNRTGAADTFTLTHLSAQGWPAGITPVTATLAHGESVTITARITISTDRVGPPDCGLVAAQGASAGDPPMVAGFYRLYRTHIPLSDAEISGPTAGVVRTGYRFTATVTPPTATTPITYTWRATGQADVTTTGQLSQTVVFTWTTAGVKGITVTAANAGSAVTGTHRVTVSVPPGDVSVAGPAEGIVSAGYGFTATVTPPTTTLPVTYTWRATGQGDVTTTGQLSQTVVFTWATAGVKGITVTAANVGGGVTGTHVVTVSVPPGGVSVAGPTTGVINGLYPFTATVGPPTATTPITYTWQASGLAPQTRVVGGVTDTLSLRWGALGRQAVTVTARNAGGVVSSTHVVTITAAAFPFYDGFEAGALGAGWTVVTDTQGRVQVSSTYPYAGSYSVLLDDSITDNTHSTATIVLTLDLEGQVGVVLDFWWREFYDENHAADGVFISDDIGASWHQVLSFNDGPLSFRRDVIYLDDWADAYGLTFNDRFQIKFQFYDRLPIELNGYAIDEVRVRPEPVTGVEIAGPTRGNVHTPYTFTAAVTPPTATLPITYTWWPTPTVGQGAAVVTYTWSVTGMQTVVVTATNVSGSASGSHAITISVPPGGVSLAGPAEGIVGVGYGFTATVTPPTTTLPVTYTWRAAGQADVTTTGQLSQTVVFTWTTAGVKGITVTAANVGGAVTGTHRVTVSVPPDDVSVAGPAEGIVGAGYGFTATVTPPTTTLPITYTWRATGQGSVTAVDGLSQTAVFTWAVPGVKGITVTAANAGGGVTGTHVVTVSVPPAGVTVAGPIQGNIHGGHRFTATVTPPTATLPITYHWRATEQTDVALSVSGVSHAVVFTWSTPGPKEVVVTATNVGGIVTDTRAITINVPPTDVSIQGRATGVVQVDYPFTAQVSPVTATQPITYTWEATEQSPVVRAGQGISDSVNFHWGMTGTKRVTVTASNVGGAVVAAHVITLGISPVSSLTVGGPITTVAYVATPFTATVEPVTATQPITYIWEATHRPGPVVHGGGGSSDTHTFTWKITGTQTITVTAVNVGGAVSVTRVITVLSATGPESVTISGPSEGIVQATHAFTATVSPISTTAPITYVWRATGGISETHVNDLTDVASLTWESPGVQVVTVTAMNPVGVVSVTHVITTRISPLTGVQIDGPMRGSIGVSYTFTATVSPVTATLPVTYHWRASDQGDVITSVWALSHSVSWAWSAPGARVITVTTMNAGGTVTDTAVITIYVPPAGVEIAGPTAGRVATPYSFTATVGPPTVTLPITYHWRASGAGQSEVVTSTGSLSDVVSFAWDEPGVQAVTVTVSNVGGSVMGTQRITLHVPLAGVSIAGPVEGSVGAPYTFTAAISPVTATAPMTYHWRGLGADRGEVVTVTAASRHTVSFTWHVPGAHAVLITVTNAGGSVFDVHPMFVNVPPSGVKVAGPEVGNLDLFYTFTATVLPPTTTTPITYHWRASGSGQSDVVSSTSELSHNVSFRWREPGVQTVTVTAANAGGVVTDTHSITVSVPPSDVEIGGPTAGSVGEALAFTANVHPATATLPITYHWRATGQDEVEAVRYARNHSVFFTWDEPGGQTITVTATNAGGTVTDTYGVVVHVPLDGVEISGPTAGGAGERLVFTATVSPLTATLPVTYHWQADGQSDVAAAISAPSHTVSFTWNSAGPKGITVTATNAGGAVVGRQTVTVSVPLVGVEVGGPTAGGIGDPITLTARVSPVTATVPITYRWRASGQADVLTTTDRLEHGASFVWHTPGVRAITVTAANVGGVVTGTHVVTISVPPLGVEIAGPVEGRVDRWHTFTATVDPPSTTTPITYHWQASGTGQGDMVAVSGLSHTASWSWRASGRQAVTVTAMNERGSVVATHAITLHVSPTGVAVDGPVAGVVGNSYAFIADVSPATATTPITYTWRATGQEEVAAVVEGPTHVLSFTWSGPGMQGITVTAANAGGVVTGTHIVAVRVPPTGAVVRGPAVGSIRAPYTFTADVSPATTTLPITYTWRAAGQGEVVAVVDGPTHVVSFTWDGPGVQGITVTAANAGGAVTGTQAIDIHVPPAGVGVDGPATGSIGGEYTFTADVSPATATTPITYHWRATGQGDVIAVVDELSHAVSFVWGEPGGQGITVTAANGGGVVTGTWSIQMYTPPSGVRIEGPDVGVIEMDYGFEAAVSPETATQPVQYTWSPAPATGQGTSAVTYRWDAPGLRTVVVTATNSGGSARDTHPIMIGVPIQSVGIAGPTQGKINAPLVLTAVFTPATATQPVEYTWSPSPAAGQGTAVAQYVWGVTGTYPISVAVSNVGGTVVGSRVVHVALYRVYLPLTIRNWPPTLDLYAIENPGGENDYTVRWSGVTGQVSYDLRESRGCAAGLIDVIEYTATEASYTFEQRRAGRYCYQVRACGAGWCGSWSNVECVDVLHEQEDNDSRSLGLSDGPICSGKVYQGIHDDDSDYFGVYLRAGERIEIDLNTPFGSGVWLLLYRGSESQSRERDYQSPYRVEYTAPETGWYYIRVYTPPELRSAGESYTLRAVFP